MSKTAKFQGILVGSTGKLLGKLRISRVTTMTLAAFAISAAISMLVAAFVLPSKIMADDNELKTFTVDVATGDMRAGLPYYQNNADPAVTNKDSFSQGDTFIGDGNIYPEGRIPDGKTDFAPDTPGAIGRYRARGTYTTDLPNFILATEKNKNARPDLYFATEIFSFSGDDRTLILTDGTVPNPYFSARRVVLGGTGRFRDVVGEVHEENIGENSLGFCNFRLTFRLRKVGEGHGR
jgi:hypothetical protein